MFHALDRHFPEQYLRGVPGFGRGRDLEQTSQRRFGIGDNIAPTHGLAQDLRCWRIYWGNSVLARQALQTYYRWRAGWPVPLSGETPMNRRGIELVEMLLVLVIVGILGALGFGIAFVVNTSPGTGEKVGSIVKLSEVGIFCKTWEAQLVRGGMANGSGSFGVQPFDFTIENGALVEQVRAAMEASQEVRLHYRTEGVTFCRSESENHFVTAIEPLGAK